MNPVQVDENRQRRLGGFASIAEGLDFAALGSGSVCFHDARGQAATVLSYADLRGRACQIAMAFRARGLARSDVIVLLAETSAEFLCTFYACQYAGVVPCPVPPFRPRSAAHSFDFVKQIAAESGAKAIVGPANAIANLATAFPSGVSLVSFEDLETAGGRSGDDVREVCDIAYIQYSSGSTARPKGVIVTQKAVMANTDAILRHGIRLTDADRALSWLPFHHDMGLVGFSIAPLCGQCSVAYLPPAAFVRRPGLWLRLISELRCTISYSPTFGYELAINRIHPEDCERTDLSCWRVAGIGGDLIRADILDSFADRFAPFGFQRSAFLPSYGMAEATLAASFDHAPQGYRVDRDSDGRSFVICGRAIPDHEIVVADDDFRQLPDRCNGNILLRGPSVMQGYLKNEDTEAVLTTDGYLVTGDRGYMTDGAVVVTGRAKDMFLVNGRNVWPEDIEWIALNEASLRHGQAVAFDLDREDGTSEINLLVQHPPDPHLRRRIVEALSTSLGIGCRVIFVAPQTIPLTSSGKLQRRRAREIWLESASPKADENP